MSKKTSQAILAIFSLIAFSIVAFLTKFKYLKSLDILINENIEKISSPTTDKIMVFITNIGGFNALSVLLSLFLIYLLFKSKQDEIFTTIFSTSSGFLLLITIKEIIERSRPENAKIFEGSFSFPSAHATMSTIFFILLALEFSKSNKAKILIWTLSIIGFLLISFTRIYLNVHYLSDTLAGIFLGTLCISVALLLFPKAFTENKKHRK